jgi:hypothetical protein
MTEQRSHPQSTVRPERTGPEQSHSEMEEYAGGLIQAREGHIPIWLLVVYAVLFIWGLYYMVVYWGGLGPGRIE